MRRQITIMALTFAICAMVGSLALAKDKSHTLKLSEDLMVNGTLVKKGEYRAKFNSATSELTIKEADDNDVVVTVKAKEMPTDKKAEYTKFETSQGADGVTMLKSITFHGDRTSIVLDDVNAARAAGAEFIELFQVD